MKAYVGVELQFHLSLISTVNGCEWSASRSSTITPGKAPHLPSKKEAEPAPEPLWALCREESGFPLPKVQPPLARVHYKCLFPEERTDQRNAQINFSLINLLLLKLLRHVSATQLEPMAPIG